MTTDLTTPGPTTPGPMTRHDGWSLERQVGFLEVLADCGNVARAAAAVGMSASSAYRLRGRAGGEIFNHGWQAAQAMAYYRLRDVALARIDHGVETATTWRGEVVATKTVFSDRLLVAMLNHLKPAAGTLGPTGLRRPADDPGHDFAATIAAYESGIASGDAPVLPPPPNGCANGCEPPAPPMTREAFMAAIMAGRNHGRDVENIDADVNFA